jgi:hypothetical protein
MRKRLGLVLVMIPAIASAAYVWNQSAVDAGAQPAPKAIEAPRPPPQQPSGSSAKPADRDDTQSQAPQQSPGEVIGVPMFA